MYEVVRPRGIFLPLFIRYTGVLFAFLACRLFAGSSLKLRLGSQLLGPKSNFWDGETREEYHNDTLAFEQPALHHSCNNTTSGLTLPAMLCT